MIRLESISIRKFRGLRDLTLNFKGKSFGICGPNGTGKSGVVDAIEFALTGNVSRLSGRGTGDVSVKAHAPHVKEKNTPQLAMVSLKVRLPNNEIAIIKRNVATPSTYSVTPDTPAIREIVNELQLHPEFALSRRDIIRYILTLPRDRAEDVQELLRLSDVEQVRKALTTICNETERARHTAEQKMTTARAELQQCLGISTIEPQALLKAVNDQRAILGLDKFEKLGANTSFKDGVPVPAAISQPKKAQASADLDAFKERLATGWSASLSESYRASVEALSKLASDKQAARLLRQHALITLGQELLDADSCPLCDLDWKRSDLEAHLGQKLQQAVTVSAELLTAKTNLNHLIGDIATFISLLDRLLATAASISPPLDMTPLSAQREVAASILTSLEATVATGSGIEEAQSALNETWWLLPQGGQEALDQYSARIDQLPEVTEQDKARDFLTLGEERFTKAVAARLQFNLAARKFQTAKATSEVYEAQRNSILTTLYADVAKDFSDYYRSLNQDDEGGFEGALIPSAAKLGFDVDFYGYGMFPPGAYHSEGHQDSMGLCLYLALMKRTLGDKFTFCVLDDVLMSIDAEHRRNVCKLLKKEFAQTQFVLTTHDRVWLKFMQTEGLIAASKTFSAWNVESGPLIWANNDAWTEISEKLTAGQVEDAAATLRHFLEYTAFTLADAFRADVRFKGDGQYTLDDLMPPTFDRWRKKISEAINVANSWGKTDEELKLAALSERIQDAYTRTQIEKWAVNPTVHYTKWQNLQSSEFSTVVTAFADMLATMRCDDCSGYVFFEPRFGSAHTIRCDCGAVFFNLKKKQIQNLGA